MNNPLFSLLREGDGPAGKAEPVVTKHEGREKKEE
jgi:hypothetical protein